MELGTISVFRPPKAAFRIGISLVNLLILPIAALLIPSINITRGPSVAIRFRSQACLVDARAPSEKLNQLNPRQQPGNPGTSGTPGVSTKPGHIVDEGTNQSLPGWRHDWNLDHPPWLILWCWVRYGSCKHVQVRRWKRHVFPLSWSRSWPGPTYAGVAVWWLEIFAFPDLLEMIGVALDHGLCPGCFNCCSKRQGYSGEQEQARRLSSQSSGYFGYGPWCLHGVLPQSWHGLGQLNCLSWVNCPGFWVNWSATHGFTLDHKGPLQAVHCAVYARFFFAFHIPEPRIRDGWVLHQPFFRGSHFHGPFFFLTVRFPHN